MTHSADAGARSRGRATEWRRPSWLQVAVIVAVLLFAFFVVRDCQQSQIRITKEQAIATAEREINFAPQNTQIRLLRQGLDRRPFWIVSLSVPRDEGENSFKKLALVRIDANTGKVTEVQEQEPRPAGQREGR